MSSLDLSDVVVFAVWSWFLWPLCAGGFSVV